MDDDPQDEPSERSCTDAPLPAVPLRRLTRFELENAIHDVLDPGIEVASKLPRDEIAQGFDNQVDALGLGDRHVDGYMDVADEVARWLSERPERLAELTGCDPESSACARTTLGTLGRRLTRRPLGERELDALARIAEPNADRDRVDLPLAIGALLQSPRVLYRWEREADDAEEVGEGELASPWVLASRLSSLIWASVPDDVLLDRAESGELATPADVASEARRMLDDPRAERGIVHFYRQWFDLMALDETVKDIRLFGRWTPEVRRQLDEETRRFVAAVLWEEDGRLETLLTASFSFLTPTLRDFYGLPVVGGPDDRFERVALSDIPRAGLLTQGAWLATHAKPNQTSPVERGRFVRERLLCAPPPPPPDDVVVSIPRLDPRATTRERFEQHRSDPACAGCHRLMDPIGLVFENFDATGRHRRTESDRTIDASGELVGTDVDRLVDGPVDLAAALLESDEVRRCVVTQWFRFAFGRGETEADTCTLDALDRAFAASDGDLRELVVALTRTEPFLRPTPAPEAP